MEFCPGIVVSQEDMVEALLDNAHEAAIALRTSAFIQVLELFWFIRIWPENGCKYMPVFYVDMELYIRSDHSILLLHQWFGAADSTQETVTIINHHVHDYVCWVWSVFNLSFAYLQLSKSANIQYQLQEDDLDDLLCMFWSRSKPIYYEIMLKYIQRIPEISSISTT